MVLAVSVPVLHALCVVIQHLLRLATNHELAVVLMNQMTTKNISSTNSSTNTRQTQLVPALGAPSSCVSLCVHPMVHGSWFTHASSMPVCRSCAPTPWFTLSTHASRMYQHDSHINMFNRQHALHVCAGETWGHASTTRVVMFWDNRVRRATLYKSPTLEERTIAFQVVQDGIRDMDLAQEEDGAKRQKTSH